MRIRNELDYARKLGSSVKPKQSEKDLAAKVFSLVREHPQMATLHLELASRWLAGVSAHINQGESAVSTSDCRIPTITEVVEQILHRHRS